MKELTTKVAGVTLRRWTKRNSEDKITRDRVYVSFFGTQRGYIDVLTGEITATTRTYTEDITNIAKELLK